MVAFELTNRHIRLFILCPAQGNSLRSVRVDLLSADITEHVDASVSFLVVKPQELFQGRLLFRRMAKRTFYL